MKNKIYIFAAIALATVSCDNSMLDFNPTDSGSGEELMKKASTAITSINGIYRSMWTAGWSTSGNTHQCFGVAAYNLAQDMMGDDLIMQSMGNGWFWYDHIYNVKNQYTSSAFRSYDVWYANYKWITNANNVINAKETMSGSSSDISYVVGQAYAIRAFGYLNLATWFARAPYNPMTGKYRWSDPGVPIYTEPTSIKTDGKPRENLETVYKQIESDIDSAIVRLGKGASSTLNKGNKSHINEYVALGIKSRVCLATGDWAGAYESASRVIKDGGYEIGGESELMGGMNDIDCNNVMWGAGIETSEQSGAYAGFFTHMDNIDGQYAKSAPKLINKQLYNHISSGDIRLKWWDPTDKESPYISRKFAFSNVQSWLGDYIYMRIEEMYFTAAEAALRLGNQDEARDLMNAVMAKRNSRYDAGNYSGTNLGATTTTWTGSLLENILIQRRVELWGEYGRIFDVRRTGQGIDRRTDDGFSTECISAMKRNGVDLSNADTYDWVLTIPKSELDANPNINEEDQNP